MSASAIEGPHPATLPVEDLLKQCSIKTGRAGGPGGQHRNKVETAVTIEHLPTGVRGTATESRSQAENRKTAVSRLRMNLALEWRTEPAEEPSTLWTSRCRGGRISVSAAHADAPALLSEVLDYLAANEFALPRASEFLGCTSSQLIKLLKLEPRALNQLNLHRQQQGLKPLK